MTSDNRSSYVERILRRTPLVGYTIRLFETGQDKELALFGINLAATLILLVGTLGYPVFIIVMWCVVAIAASLIFSATRV
ncbi:MAG: hypothetical protein ABL898_07795 [Hyphomicrobiaceae bacterium]